MLVLSRKRDEKILVGDNIVITVCDLFGGKVRLGIEAPPDVIILREELKGRPRPFTQKAEKAAGEQDAAEEPA